MRPIGGCLCGVARALDYGLRMLISARGKRGGGGRRKNGGGLPRGVGHARASHGRPTSIFFCSIDGMRPIGGCLCGLVHAHGVIFVIFGMLSNREVCPSKETLFPDLVLMLCSSCDSNTFP
jgi:hypothetical protein